MPVSRTLGLPAWDKSFFGLRRSDRPFSPPPQADTLAKIDIAPALPPLQVLSKKSSFANILDQIQLSDSDNTQSAQAPEPVPVPVVDSVADEDPTLTSFLNISEEEEDAETSSVAKSVKPVNPSIHPSDSTMTPATSRQEHRESSTSSTSHSDHSDDLSARTSTSSLSSLEDVSRDDKILVEQVDEKPVARRSDKLVQPVPDSTSNTPEDADSDLALRHERSASMFVRSRGTNKPLPPDPFKHSRKGKEAIREQRVPKTSKVPLPSRIPTLPKRSAYRENPCKIAPLEVNTTRYKSLQKRTSNVAGQVVSGDAAERVVLRIMRNLDSLSDLRAAAMVNKGFYCVFQRYETDLVSRVLMNASRPAWELRQLIQQEQRRNPFRIKSVQRDMSALDALKAFIVMKCEKSCRRSTLDGLLGMDLVRRRQIDDALWRIWLFCKLFGKGALKESTIQTQISWLEGKVKQDRGEMVRPHVGSKRRGVSMQEIEDMTEMWNCLEMLLAGFRGREEEARGAGIFNLCFIDEGKGRTEADYLEEWIYDILSVGPKAVLTLTSCSFEHARVLGVTKWTPPRSGKGRRSFLKAALEQVYRERLVTEARQRAEEFAKSAQAQAIQKQVSQERSAPEPQVLSQITTQPLPPVRRPKSEPQIPSPKHRVSELDATEVSPERISQNVFAGIQRESVTTSLVTDAASYSHLAMTNRASARLGASLFPINTGIYHQHQKQDSDESIPETSSRNSIDLELEPKVVDPTDRAISLLVKQLGFSAAQAKQALALSDNGSGVNVQRAVEILSNGKMIEQKETTIMELPGHGSLTTVRQSQEYCEGTCRRVSLVRRDTAKKRGFLSRTNSKQRESIATSTVSNYEEDNAMYESMNGSHTTTVTVTNSRTVDPQEGLPNLADFIKFRQGLRPQNSVSSQYSQARNHKKSSSTGTVETIQEDPHQYDSPVSPLTSTATEASRHSDETITGRTTSPLKDDEERPQRIVRRTTLTRVGTMKKPTNGRLNLARHVLKKESMPEIIGYTYSNAA